MMRKKFALAVGLLSVAAATAPGQEIQVSRTNRTISVSATESVQVDPEIGEVQMGYHNYGRTQDQAYQENLRAADKITKALLDAGIPKESIETQAVNLEQVDSEDKNWTPEQRKERQFAAHQSWKIRVPVAEAQKAVDLAVSAGANEVQDVGWTVTDPKTLDAKAGAAALAKARALAGQMAQQLGAKVGELLYASNTRPVLNLITRSGVVNTESAMLGVVRAVPPPPMLKLFPKKVQAEATIYAVFALD